MIDREMTGRILRLEEMLRHDDEWIRELERRIRKAESGPGTSGTGIFGSGSVLRRIRSTSGVSGRSGTTAGSGSGVLVDFDGSDYSDGDAITLVNISGTAWSTDKYGWGQWYNEGIYEIVSMEC